MMKHIRPTLLLAAITLSAPFLMPQAAPSLPQRSMGVVVNSRVLALNGDWKQTVRLREYAKDNQGSYIIFTASDGGMYRLDDSEAVAMAERLYAPLERANKRQEVLVAQQSTLRRRQDELSSRAPTGESVADEQRKVAAEQTSVGQLQAQVGAEQRSAGVNYYNAVLRTLDVALAQGACRKLDQP